jgi:hypothetical protein
VVLHLFTPLQLVVVVVLGLELHNQVQVLVESLGVGLLQLHLV